MRTCHLHSAFILWWNSAGKSNQRKVKQAILNFALNALMNPDIVSMLLKFKYLYEWLEKSLVNEIIFLFQLFLRVF